MGGRGSNGIGGKGSNMITLYHATTKYGALGIVEDQKLKTSQYSGGYAFFSTAKDVHNFTGFGSYIVSIKVPRSHVLRDTHPDMKGLGALKVSARNLRGATFKYEGMLDDFPKRKR